MKQAENIQSYRLVQRFKWILRTIQAKIRWKLFRIPECPHDSVFNLSQLLACYLRKSWICAYIIGCCTESSVHLCRSRSVPNGDILYTFPMLCRSWLDQYLSEHFLVESSFKLLHRFYLCLILNDKLPWNMKHLAILHYKLALNIWLEGSNFRR